MNTADLSALQKGLGLAFADISFLEQALLHPSFAHESHQSGSASNQRLELLGDALIDFVITEYLFHRFPELREGKLTDLRSQLVCQETLAKVADTFKLGEYLYLGCGEEASGGRERPSNLASALEALVASVFLDQGLERARDFVLRALRSELEAISEGESKNYKALLQEFLQAKGELPSYQVAETSGPEHDKQFKVVVVSGGETLGTGWGRSKKLAESNAARIAWENLSGRVNI